MLKSPRVRPRRAAAAGVLLALVSGAAWAAITSVTGAGEQIGPADVRVGQTEDNDFIRGIDESGGCFQSNSGPAVDYGVRPGGCAICTGFYIECHLLHLDPEGNGDANKTATFNFDFPVLALAYNSATLDAWDSTCGLASGMVYPNPGAEAYRGLEPSATPDDDISVVAVGGVYNRVVVTFEVTSYTDQVRVITCCDGNCENMIPDWSQFPGP